MKGDGEGTTELLILNDSLPHFAQIKQEKGDDHGDSTKPQKSGDIKQIVAPVYRKDFKWGNI